MNKIGSIFYKDILNQEQSSKQKVFFFLGSVLGLGIAIGASLLEVPIPIMYFLLFIFVTPFILYGTGQNKKIYGKMMFFFVQQTRTYELGKVDNKDNGNKKY